MSVDSNREGATGYRLLRYGYVPCEKVEPGVFSSERVVSIKGLDGKVFSGLFDEGCIIAGKLEVRLYAQNRDGTALLVRPVSGDFFQDAALWVPKEMVVEKSRSGHVVYGVK